jgi:hypothetical protein
MNKHVLISHIMTAIIAVGFTSMAWHTLSPPPPPIKPPAPLYERDIRGVVNYLRPVAFDYSPYGAGAAYKQNARVQVCASADDSVSIIVDTGYDEHIAGTGQSLREAENDLGKKSSAVANLMN